LAAAKCHQHIESSAGSWHKSYTVDDNLVGLAAGLRIHTEGSSHEGTRRTSIGDDCGTRGDADAGGNSIHSGRQDSTEIASKCWPHTGRALVADAVQPLWRLLSRSPDRLLEMLHGMPDYDDKVARGTDERNEDKPRIGMLCHPTTNGDSVCGRYNSPRLSSVEGANCIGRVRHVGEEEWNALESGKVVCDAAAGSVPTSRWFPTRGRENTGSKQSEIFGNGTRCERGHGRIIARKDAGWDGAIDGNTKTINDLDFLLVTRVLARSVAQKGM
jgi:hypothetical protein